MSIENLTLLRDFLLENRKNIKNNFGMSQYLNVGYAISDVQNLNPAAPVCGTAACAVGWAPCIIPHDVKKFTRVNTVGTEVFEYNDFCDTFLVETGGEEWDWLFTGGWSEVDDTIEGAIFRLNYFLIYGLPGESFNGYGSLDPSENFYEADEYDEGYTEFLEDYKKLKNAHPNLVVSP